MRVFLRLAIAAAAAWSLMAAGLAGKWTGSMETQMGATEVVITVNPGAGLAGRVVAGEYEAAIENAKVDAEEPERQERAGRGWRLPNGGLYSTLDDLAKWVAFESGAVENAAVLSKKTLEGNSRASNQLTAISVMVTGLVFRFGGGEISSPSDMTGYSPGINARPGSIRLA